MFDAPASPACSPLPPAETRAERRMRRLEAMAEIGVAMGRRMDRQSEMAAAYAESGLTPDTATWSRRVDEIGRAFAQVCRAVSVATAIEDRIDRGLPALPELDRARRLREQALSEKRAEATTAMERSFDADPEITNPRRLVGLKLNLDRLLDREVLDLDGFLARPLPQLVARLRRDLGLSVEEDAGLWGEDPSPGRGRVTSGGPQGGPHAIANDLAIAARNAEAKAQAGPAAPQREDGVTDAGRQIPAAHPPEPSSATSTEAPPATTAWLPPRAVTPSSRAGLRCAPARGALPSPCRGRNPAPP